MKKSELRQIIKEEIKRVLSEKKDKISLQELSPELLARASDKASQLGRNVQSGKFSAALNKMRMKKAADDREAKYGPLKPFQSQTTNWYYESKKGKGKEEFEIDNIHIQENDMLVLYLKPKSSKYLPDAGLRVLAYGKDADSWATINDGYPWFKQGEYHLLGTDMATAQLLTKITKAYNPETTVTPNGLIKGVQTPLLGKHFQI